MMRVFVLLLLSLSAAACNQNIEIVRNGERFEDSPRPAVSADAGLAPLPGAGDSGSSGQEREVPPFVKAFFMHTWVEALYSPPRNQNPNPRWSSPLADPSNRVWCTDCHVSGQVDFEKIPKMRAPMVDELEKDRHFMADLMKKWVARLNSDQFKAKAKLKGPVTCLSCHATDPSVQ